MTGQCYEMKKESQRVLTVGVCQIKSIKKNLYYGRKT